MAEDDLATVRKPQFKERILWLRSPFITQTDYGRRFEQVHSNDQADVLFECVYSVFLISA